MMHNANTCVVEEKRNEKSNILITYRGMSRIFYLICWMLDLWEFANGRVRAVLWSVRDKRAIRVQE